MAKSASFALYYAWMRARAAWNLVQFSPEYLGEDVPDEINSPLCDADTEALNAFLLCPAETAVDLSRKLRVFRDEAIADGWNRAAEIASVLAKDAHRIAFQMARAA